MKTTKTIDYLKWMGQNLRIIDFDGDDVPLIANIAQQKVHLALQRQHNEGLPVRAIILKARREGVSTYVQGRYFCDVNHLPNHYACICSADLKASDKVFQMSRRFQEKMPPGLKKATKYEGRKEIVYKTPHASEFIVQTAGKGVLGRGGLTHYLHLTEFAFWERAKEQFGGASQEVPDRHNTAIIIESTANGVGDAFYDIYWQAVEDWKQTQDLNNYIPLFLPWYIFPEYQLKCQGTLKLTDEEEYLRRNFELTDSQLSWRRWAIKNKCQGDIHLFKQEYPATALEAFQEAGNPVFPATLLDKQLKSCKPYLRYGIFVEDGDSVTFQQVDRTINCWAMAEPRKGHSYAMGIDPMMGKTVDPKNKRADIDYHGVLILNRHTHEFDCMYTGRGPQYELGEQCVLAARYYNDAWVAPEIPSGMEVLNVFKRKGYENLYNKQIHDDQMSADDTDSFGWCTTITSRPNMVESFVTALRDGIKVIFPELLSEMRTFIRDKTGKPIHNVGKHDDLLFAAMIALQVHMRCPQEGIDVGVDTGDYIPAAVTLRELAHSGAIDPGVHFDEEEYEYTD